VTRFTREESEIFVRRGLGLSYIAMPAGRVFLGQKKKFHGTGEVEPESRRRDDDAGPLRETRGTRKEKRQIEMSSADEATGLALAFVDRWAINISGSSDYWNCYN
jgi:hypothetical protein